MSVLRSGAKFRNSVFFNLSGKSEAQRGCLRHELGVRHTLALTFFEDPGRIMAMPIVNSPTYLDPITGKEIPFAGEARGSIAKTRTYQFTTVTIDGNMANRRRVQQQKTYHVPFDPKTEAQLAIRQKVKDGAAEWNALSPEEKEIWNIKADLRFQNRNDKPGSWIWICGYSLFLSAYLLSH